MHKAAEAAVAPVRAGLRAPAAAVQRDPDLREDNMW